MKLCEHCQKEHACLRRPKNRMMVCKECFYELFETEIHDALVRGNVFSPGDRIAIGVSGGKDSTVLAHVLKTLNDRYKYGVELTLLSVDEGIRGYRDFSLEVVKSNEKDFGLPLRIVSFAEMFGMSLDEIVSLVGLRNTCTYCGVFRRQALDKGAAEVGATKLATGHNADDLAETVIMNLLRGDIPRLARCVAIVSESSASIPRIKPFKYTYEKEIVLYAYHKKLKYFSTECTYSPQAFRGFAREYIKEMEKLDSSCLLNIIHSAEQMRFAHKDAEPKTLKECELCGYQSSQRICRGCGLRQQLNELREKKRAASESVGGPEAEMELGTDVVKG